MESDIKALFLPPFSYLLNQHQASLEAEVGPEAYLVFEINISCSTINIAVYQESLKTLCLSEYLLGRGVVQVSVLQDPLDLLLQLGIANVSHPDRLQPI